MPLIWNIPNQRHCICNLFNWLKPGSCRESESHRYPVNVNGYFNPTVAPAFNADAADVADDVNADVADDRLRSHFDATDDDDKPTWAAR